MSFAIKNSLIGSIHFESLSKATLVLLHHVTRLLRLTFVYKSFKKCIYFSQFMVLFGRIVNISCLVFIFAQ